MFIETTFKQMYRPLCLYAMHYLHGDADSAEDIVQDCFAKLWETDTVNTRSFLYTAVRNACIDHLRRQHPEVTNFAPCDLDGIITDDDARQRSAYEARLWESIDSLPKRCREVLLMGKRDGMTYQEIADELGLSVKTVEHQMSKALKRLRETGTAYMHLPFVLAIA